MNSTFITGDNNTVISDQEPHKISLISPVQPIEPDTDIDIVTLEQPDTPNQFLSHTFETFQHRLDSIVVVNKKLIGYVNFYDNGIRVDRYSLDDFTKNGFTLERSSSTVTFTNTETGKQYISPNRTQPLTTIDSTAKIEKQLPQSPL